MTEGTIIIERTDDCPDFPYTIFRVDGDGFKEYVDSVADFPAAERYARFLNNFWGV